MDVHINLFDMVWGNLKRSLSAEPRKQNKNPASGGFRNVVLDLIYRISREPTSPSAAHLHCIRLHPDVEDTVEHHRPAEVGLKGE